MKKLSLLMILALFVFTTPALADCGADHGTAKSDSAAEKKAECPHAGKGDAAGCAKCAEKGACPDCAKGCDGEEGCAGCVEKGCADGGCEGCAEGCAKSDCQKE